MKTFIITSLLLFSMQAPSKEYDHSSSPVLRTDGIYQEDPPRKDNNDHPMRIYLRFYDNGVYITKQTFVEPEGMIKNFIQGNQYVTEGTYKVTGEKITYSYSFKSPLNESIIISRGDGIILPDGKLQVIQKGLEDDKEFLTQNIVFRFIKIAAE